MGLAQFIKRKIMSITPTAARALGGPWTMTYPALADGVNASAQLSAPYALGVMKQILATAPADLWIEAIQVMNADAAGEWLCAITQEPIATVPAAPTPGWLEICVPVYFGAVNTARLIEVRPPCLIHAGNEINCAVAIDATATGPKKLEVKIIVSRAK